MPAPLSMLSVILCLMNLLESTEAMHGGLIIKKMVFDLFLPNSSWGDFFFLSFGGVVLSNQCANLFCLFF